MHEILHALGFSVSSWPLFRNADMSPQTARESDGLPAVVSVTCVDGVQRNILEISTSTLQFTSAERNGTRTARIVTPRVRSLARQLFGCDILEGAEASTAGSCPATLALPMPRMPTDEGDQHAPPTDQHVSLTIITF